MFTVLSYDNVAALSQIETAIVCRYVVEKSQVTESPDIFIWLGSQQGWEVNRAGKPTRLGSQQSWEANKAGKPVNHWIIVDGFIINCWLLRFNFSMD